MFKFFKFAGVHRNWIIKYKMHGLYSKNQMYSQTKIYSDTFSISHITTDYLQ